MSGHAEILAIGDELVHGALLDTNSRWLTQVLEQSGVPVRRFTVVGDDPDDLQDAMQRACERAGLVVATGGLGPTLDDRTRDVAAVLAGGEMWFDAHSWQRIVDWLGRRRRPVPDSNRRQAMFPAGAVVLDNDFGTAPGFRLRLGQAELFAFPGVPREMQGMVQQHLLPFVRALPGARPTAHHNLYVAGPSEALLGERIEAFMAPGASPAVGITASSGLLTIRIVAAGQDAGAVCAATAAALRPLVREWLLGEGDLELPEHTAQALLASGTTLALAESCTGGMVAEKLTGHAGISSVFRGGVVAYANAAKQDLLGVDAGMLAAHGAVSEPVALAMARGAAERLGADLGLAVTGIAGPGGGSPEKPVGTVCFGQWWQGAGRAWTLRIPDLGRDFIRQRATVEVLAAILRAVANKS